jgi:RNA polymerase sigma-70 factor, ECF subfamily
MTSFDQADAIARVIAGEANAFEAIVQEYKEFVAIIVARYVPEANIVEVSQDTFVEAFRSLKKLRATREFRSWLQTIATRRCYDFWRKRYSERTESLDALTEEQKNWIVSQSAENQPSTPEESFDRKVAHETLTAALAMLEPTDRMILQLVHLEERSSSEISKLLSCSIATIKVRAFRARRALREVLRKAHPEGK